MTHQGQSWMGTVFLRQHGPHKHQQNKENRRAGCLQLCRDCSRDSATVSLILLFHPNHTFKKNGGIIMDVYMDSWDQANTPFLVIPSRVMSTHKLAHKCSELYRITRNWRQPTCPSVGEWINKFWYLQTMEYHSVRK